MLNSQRGFIASDGGILLSTENGGRDWNVIDTKDVSINFKTIESLKIKVLQPEQRKRFISRKTGALTGLL
jgi:hypothetical protein